MSMMMSMEKDREREVLELLKVVMKTANAEEESRCLDALSTLNSFPVSSHLLSSDDVQRYFTVLRTHPIQNIRCHVRDVIRTWKRRVFTEPPKHEENNATKEKKSRKVKVLLPKKAVSARTNNDKVGNVGVRDKKMESLKKSDSKKALSMEIDQDLPSCNDALRDKIRGLLYKGLCGVFDDDVQQDMKERINVSKPIEVAVSLESALFKKWGHATGSSSSKYRSVLFNIKDPKNPDFRRKLLAGEIKAESVANMSKEEMASEKRKREDQHIKAKALLKSIIGMNRKGTTDEFKCSHCGESETTYYQLQTRSADEPMTTYVTCVNCDHHWKEN